jgi:two-component system cell cycle sensor histidine kinase/response regulator CckA
MTATASAAEALSALSAPRRLEALADAQLRVVELLMKQAPLREVLDSICRGVEGQLAHTLCSVLLLDPDGVRLRLGAGPSFVADYLALLEGQAIGPNVGSCGAAMFRRERVVVEDIAKDPLWQDCRTPALSNGLAACASTPVFDGAGNVIGSLALYHRSIGPFGVEELEILQHTSSLAALAISHHRQMEALGQQTERLTMAQRLARLGFWTWWVADNRVVWSEGLYEIYGLDHATFAASFEGYLSRVHPDDRVMVQATIGKALETSKSFAFEERIVRPDGETRWLRSWGTVVLDREGRPEQMMGTCLDVTDLKTGELDLLQFRALVENSPDFVAIASMDTRVQYVNPAGMRLIGLDSLEVARTHSIRDLLTPEGYRQAHTLEIPAVTTVGHWEGESTLRHLTTGEVIPVQITHLLVREPGTGKPVCLASFQHDLRSQKRTEEALRQAQKMEAIGGLAGGIAHDFNNLLSVILSYSELLSHGLRESDPMHEGLKEIGAAALSAGRLTRQLLAYSRRQVLNPRIVDLDQLVSSMEGLLRRLIGEDVELVVRGSAALVNVLADPGQIEQVLMNLAANARDAMPRGGKLMIETASVDLDDEYARQRPGVMPGAYVMLVVTDNGSGMDSAMQARIFEPFFTTKEKGRGTGLGLATVHGIVRQSGGHVWVYSEVGRGSTFKVYLPRANGEPVPMAAMATVAEMRGTETVLLVEDDAQLRVVMRGILKRQGYQVLDAQNGGEALLLCERFSGTIHILITDVVMPNMSGREVAERLQELRPAMKILYVSGYTDNTIVHHGILDAGINFLEKPITPDALARKVREVLDARPPTTQASIP